MVIRLFRCSPPVRDSRWSITILVRPLAFFIGATAGIRLVAYLDADFVKQIQSTIIPLLVYTADVVDGPARREVGQLAGRSALQFRSGNDGTPDRALVSFVVRAPAGTTLEVTAAHPRAGRTTTPVSIGDGFRTTRVPN